MASNVTRSLETMLAQWLNFDSLVLSDICDFGNEFFSGISFISYPILMKTLRQGDLPFERYGL